MAAPTTRATATRPPRRGAASVPGVGAGVDSQPPSSDSLLSLGRIEEAKSVLRKMIPVARRVLGEGVEITISIRSLYAQALCRDPDATLDDLREAVTRFEDTERIVRRVFGGAHPTTVGIERDLRKSRAALRAREAPPTSG